MGYAVFDEEVKKNHEPYFSEGEKARVDGIRLANCPYPKGPKGTAWSMGWCDRDMIILNEEQIEYTMVNVNHPCYEIDIWHTTNEQERQVAIGQGYVSLFLLRELVAKYHDQD